jgi:SPP1 gp7 family putative phage head morphogenesis protein
MNQDVYASSVARSEIQRAVNNGRVYGYQESQIAKTLEWHANPGASEECVQRNGSIYEVNDATDILPSHVNCRCTWVVDTYKDFDEVQRSPDIFDTSNIISDPNGVGITELMKLSDEECDKFIGFCDNGEFEQAIKYLKKITGEE